MPQSFASIHCHIVFSTKQRDPVISTDLQLRLFQYIGGTTRNHSSRLIYAGGMPDHVHLLVSLGRVIAVADLVRVIKSNSSSWLRSEVGARDFGWQNGYGAFAVRLFTDRPGEELFGKLSGISPGADVSG